jgi:hypothetical protein
MKLHSFTTKLYIDPLLNSADGIGVGGDALYALVRNRWSSVAFAEVSTVHVWLVHALPPLPEEPVISRTRESQPPIVLGAEMVTVGDTADAELRMLTPTVLRARCQLLVSQLLVWHCAFNTASTARDTGESTAAHPVPLLTKAFTCLLLTHTHVDARSHAKLKSAEQVNCVATLPLSVLESNRMAT